MPESNAVPIVFVAPAGTASDAYAAVLADVPAAALLATPAEASEVLARHDPAALVIDAVATDAATGLDTAARLLEGRTATTPAVLLLAADPSADLRRSADRIAGLELVRWPDGAAGLRSKLAAWARTREGRVPQSETTSAARAERLRLFMECATDYAVLFFDEDRVITEWTPGAEAILRLPAHAAIGQSADLIFTETDRAAGVPLREVATALAEGQANDERWHRRADGSLFFGFGRLVALRDERGGRHGFAKILRDVTEQRERDESLRETLSEVQELQRAAEQSGVRYREIFETANEGIWTLDQDGRIELVNQRLAAMLGYRIEEMIGRVNVEFGFPEDVARWRERFAERRRGLPAWIDVRFRHRRGHEVWALMSARPLLRQGLFAGELDMFTDVTARRAAEQALRVSEEQFRTFFESAAAGHASIDPRTRLFLRVNRRFGEITGYAPQELRGRAFSSLTHADDQAADAEQFARLLSGAVQELSQEKRFVHKTGRVVWVQVNSTLVRDADHQPLRQISVVQDITDRKLGEIELNENRTQLALALESAELGMFFHDTDTNAEHWNARAKQLLGVPPEVAESFDVFLSRVHPGDRAEVERKLRETFAATEDRSFKLDFRVLPPDGVVHHVAATGRVIWRGEGERRSSRILATMRDVTDAKNFEQYLQAQVEQRTAQLEVKTAQLEGFCYTVAHDLRSPLRAISGYADFLLQDLQTAPDDPAAGYVSKIKAASRRLDALISDLLHYSRVAQSGVSIENVPLDLALREARAHLAEDIEARGAVIEMPSGLPIVRAERSMLEQVLINLLSNAMKFVAPGTTPRVTVSVEERGENVRLTVADNGIGVAQAYHRRIFGVFERLSDAKDYPGTGVGLAIVQKAIERVGGTFGVESESGQGSRFWIELRKARE